jgi:recombination protein RecT
MEQKKIDLKTINGFSETIVKYKGSITKFLNPKYGITPEDFIETCIRVVREMPKLLQCDPKSLFGSILFCAEIGLKPNTPLGHAYILPYKGKAKFQIGYKGLIEIMYRNPRVKQITARAVFKNDFFEYNYGLRPDLIHKPARTEKGQLECVYATCLIDNEPVFVVVEKSELDSIKKLSPSFNSDLTELSAYNNGTDIHNWMEIKSSVKALSKLIPTSNNIEIAKAVEYDSRFEGGAIALVDIPNSPNEVVEPRLLGGDFKTNTLDTSFDSFDITEQEPAENSTTLKNSSRLEKLQESIMILKAKQAPELVQQEQVIKQAPEPVQQEQVIEQASEPVQQEQVIEQAPEPVQQEQVIEQDDSEWELPIGDFNDDDEPSDSSDNVSFENESSNPDDDDDIRFDFPDGEDDDNEETQSSLF